MSTQIGQLWSACGDGDLDAVMRLSEGMTMEEARLMDSYILHVACGHGHLAVAQWLAKHFGLTAEDARAKQNWALRHACKEGHLAVAQWMVDHFGLVVEDAGEYADILDFSGMGLGPKSAAKLS